MAHEVIGMTSPKQPIPAHERHDPIERCWLCGIRLPAAQMVPDGGSACADVRWYCRDLRACTGRWADASWPRPGHDETVSGANSARTP